jgi:hypothetical protein
MRVRTAIRSSCEDRDQDPNALAAAPGVAVDVVDVPPRHGCDRLLGRGVDDSQAAGTGRLDPLAVNVPPFLITYRRSLMRSR